MHRSSFCQVGTTNRSDFQRAFFFRSDNSSMYNVLCKFNHVHSNRLNASIFIPLTYLNPYITKEILKALEQRIPKTEILSKLGEKQKLHTQHIAV